MTLVKSDALDQIDRIMRDLYFIDDRLARRETIGGGAIPNVLDCLFVLKHYREDKWPSR
jgi:hypothetical protein